MSILDPTIHRIRLKVSPLLPQSPFFDIPDTYKTTIDGKRFLLADESPIRRERLLIFSSDRQLDLLFQSPVVYMDGTFSKSPPFFTQIYILHGVFIDTCMFFTISMMKTYLFLGLPCVFCLVMNKKGVTYRHIFTELKEIARNRGKNFSPMVIMSDFESGVIPVVKSEVCRQCSIFDQFRNLLFFSFQRQNISAAFFISLRQSIDK